MELEISKGIRATNKKKLDKKNDKTSDLSV